MTVPDKEHNLIEFVARMLEVCPTSYSHKDNADFLVKALSNHIGCSIEVLEGIRTGEAVVVPVELNGKDLSSVFYKYEKPQETEMNLARQVQLNTPTS